MGAIVVIIVFLGYGFLTYKIGLLYWRKSASHRAVTQITGRTLLLPMLWGIGMFGVEGFGFFGPIVPSTLMSLLSSRDAMAGYLATTWITNVLVALLVSLVVAFVNRYKAGGASTELPDVSVAGAAYHIADHLSQGLLPPRNNKDVPVEFEELKSRVFGTVSNDDLPVELKRLRSFLDDNGLAQHKQVREFYSRWLTHMNVSAGVTVSNAYSSSEAKELKGELWRIQL